MEAQPAQRLWPNLRSVDVVIVMWALIFVYCILLPTFFVLDSTERKQKWLNNITTLILQAAPDLKASTNVSTVF
jgi:hypothetical protein